MFDDDLSSRLDEYILFTLKQATLPPKTAKKEYMSFRKLSFWNAV